ncbi:hypothetical protein [Roseicitreum antarcticum]|uniref:Uncharacterized protein n=1 Tax=Roseicitreum antarcticum TaxID=564137 RepID=A0A1H2UST8_9RHOB|nr:hypothetical protein [Roseicitreum antarcticum]SDW58624.1 hypothetical protein SAMN04488238_102471 [Roseicitreum antarcticum]
MQHLIDIAIGAGALLAAAYCLMLSRRLRALTRLDGDVGNAIALLSAQVDALNTALIRAQKASEASVARLSEQTTRADNATRQLELLLASMHGVPASAAPPPVPNVGPSRARVVRKRFSEAVE